MPDLSASNEAVATQEPRIVMSDAELERLLDEATSLSQELAEEAGDVSNEALQEGGGHQEEAAAPPIEAVEPEPPDVAPPAAEQTKPLPDLLQDPDAATAAAPAEAEPEPTAREDATPEANGPPASPRPSVKIETRDEETARKAASPEPVEEELSEPEDAQGEERQDRPSLKNRLVASCKLAMRLGRAVPIGVVNGCLMIFILLDRPFRGVSPGLKRMLGLVGLATLLTGIATWFLPDMMNNNPFAEMERYIKRSG